MSDSVTVVQRINLSTSLTQAFVSKFEMTDELFEKAITFWKEFMNLNLIPVRIQKLFSTMGNSVKVGSFTVEGGNFWTLQFENYRKIVDVYFCSLYNHTYTQVQLQLPGAYNLNAQDIEKVNHLIKSFQNYLESLAAGD